MLKFSVNSASPSIEFEVKRAMEDLIFRMASG
jgi:hypothetical protein